jgi:hypothetical protein
LYKGVEYVGGQLSCGKPEILFEEINNITCEKIKSSDAPSAVGGDVCNIIVSILANYYAGKDATITILSNAKCKSILSSPDLIALLHTGCSALPFEIK